MSWVLVLGIIIIFFIILKIKSANEQSGEGDLPYKYKGPLFTPAERSFLGVLKLATKDRVEVFGKVRVADVITPENNLDRSLWQKLFNKISRKHFDFVLCSKETLDVICTIELNDASHNSKKQIARDNFLKQACDSARIKLIMLPATKSYSVVELQNILEPLFSKDSKEVTQLINKAELTSDTSEPQDKCPKCSSDLVLRKAKRGQNKGNEFLACSAFPSCRYIEDSVIQPIKNTLK